MSKVFDLFRKKQTLVSVDGDLCIWQLRQYSSQVRHVAIDFFKKITISSRYSRFEQHFNDNNMRSIACSNITGAVFKPKDIPMNCESP